MNESGSPEPDPSPSEQAGSEAAVPPPPLERPGSKRLTRSRDDRVIAGVCGGVGEYLGVDAVLVRIAALLLVFAGGAGLVLYVIGWIAMPEAPDVAEPRGEPAPEAPAPAPERARGALFLGLLFVALGVFFLVDEIWPDLLSWQYVWPIALIAIGIAVVARARR
jgi:phage shock protein C